MTSPPPLASIEAFERRAWTIFRQIPRRYREGVDGVVVRRETVPHPELPEIYTLGVCETSDWPSAYGGTGEVHSSVVLYYGSFRALQRTDPAFDWEAELWETLVHEVRHHLESLASEDALERLDYAEDRNFARVAGEEFDPYYYRQGERVGKRIYRVGDDWFVERTIDDREAAAGETQVGWRGDERRIALPGPAARVTFVRLGPDESGFGDVYAVLLRRRPFWSAISEWLRGSETPRVAEYDLSPEDGAGDRGDAGAEQTGGRP